MSNVLLALTSHGELGSTGRATGFYVPEAAHPYYELTGQGHNVDFVSAAGGEPPKDGISDDPVVQRFLADPVVTAKLADTPTPEALTADDYDVIYFVGGHGAMWDFPGPGDLQDLAGAIYQRGGVVAAVCHGPAALVDLRLPGGEQIVAGKRIATFTDAEETAVGLNDVVPFLLQTRLTDLGALVQTAPNFEENAVADGRLVTGQNPASATKVARLALEALASSPVGGT